MVILPSFTCQMPPKALFNAPKDIFPTHLPTKLTLIRKKPQGRGGEKETHTDIFSQKAAWTEDARHKGTANQPKNRNHHAERVRRETHAMPSHASRRNLAASQAWKCSALRRHMHRAAMADAARCDEACTALHFSLFTLCSSLPTGDAHGFPRTPATARASDSMALRSTARCVPTLRRMKPSPPGPNISPSLSAKWASSTKRCCSWSCVSPS